MIDKKVPEMPSVLSYFIVREPVMGSIRVVHKTRDAGLAAFEAMIRDGDYEDCLEFLEIVTNDRGRVIAEGITHSYSKVSNLIVTHVVTPLIRPIPSKDGPMENLAL